MIKIEKTAFKDLLIIKPEIYDDSRGYFYEAYNKNNFKKDNINISFVQHNLSKSKYGVLRWIHFTKISNILIF